MVRHILLLPDLIAIHGRLRGRVEPGHGMVPVLIFCFLSGGALFGIVGWSVPVALAVRSILGTLYDEDRSETENTWCWPTGRVDALFRQPNWDVLALLAHVTDASKND